MLSVYDNKMAEDNADGKLECCYSLCGGNVKRLCTKIELVPESHLNNSTSDIYRSCELPSGSRIELQDPLQVSIARLPTSAVEHKDEQLTYLSFND